jgi:hypothetical protein
MTLDEFFEGFESSRPIFEAVREAAEKLHEPGEVDEEVRSRLREAWESAE